MFFPNFQEPSARFFDYKINIYLELQPKHLIKPAYFLSVLEYDSSDLQALSVSCSDLRSNVSDLRSTAQVQAGCELAEYQDLRKALQIPENGLWAGEV